jgi:hypothetical protein
MVGCGEGFPLTRAWGTFVSVPWLNCDAKSPHQQKFMEAMKLSASTPIRCEHGVLFHRGCWSYYT